MIGESYRIQMVEPAKVAIKWMLGICICYFTISIVMRTKDDFRFVVPYVEFAKQTKGAAPPDPRHLRHRRRADLRSVRELRLFDALIIVPRFVLNELQLIADSADKLSCNRPPGSGRAQEDAVQPGDRGADRRDGGGGDGGGQPRGSEADGLREGPQRGAWSPPTATT